MRIMWNFFKNTTWPRKGTQEVAIIFILVVPKWTFNFSSAFGKPPIQGLANFWRIFGPCKMKLSTLYIQHVNVKLHTSQIFFIHWYDINICIFSIIACSYIELKTLNRFISFFGSFNAHSMFIFCFLYQFNNY